MKLNLLMLTGLFLASLYCVSVSVAQHSPAISLFNNKDLSNWDIYIGPGLDSQGRHRARFTRSRS
jgi:hypothetical protein